MVLAHLILAKLGALIAAAYAFFGVSMSIGVALAAYVVVGNVVLFASVAVALWMARRSEADDGYAAIPEPA